MVAKKTLYKIDQNLFHDEGIEVILSEIIKKANASWRLMSDGITHRLGVLTGQIRVYKEELVKLIK